MIKSYLNNAAFDFQKHGKNRTVLSSLFPMLDNLIVPFATEWFPTVAGLVVSTQKVYRYDENLLSFFYYTENINEIRTFVQDTALIFIVETKGNVSRIYTTGGNITNLINGVYTLEIVDSSGQIHTLHPFKVCQDTASEEDFYILVDDLGTYLTDDGITPAVWEY